jgi:hypothetical protein
MVGFAVLYPPYRVMNISKIGWVKRSDTHQHKD